MYSVSLTYIYIYMNKDISIYTYMYLYCMCFNALVKIIKTVKCQKVLFLMTNVLLTIFKVEKRKKGLVINNLKNHIQYM